LAVRTMPLRAADARAVVTLAVGQGARRSTQLDGAVEVGPGEGAVTATILAHAMSRAFVGARRDGAVNASEPTTAQASSVAAVAVARAVVLASERRAIR